jgi:hypothetical protein
MPRYKPRTLLLLLAILPPLLWFGWALCPISDACGSIARRFCRFDG